MLRDNSSFRPSRIEDEDIETVSYEEPVLVSAQKECGRDYRVIIVNDVHAFAVVDCYRSVMKLNGKIVLGTEVLFEIFFRDNVILVASAKNNISEYLLDRSAKLLVSSFRCSLVLILDGLKIPGSVEISEKLRYICTDEGDWLDFSSACEELEIGSVVRGFTASMICACESRQISCLAVLCVRDASYSIEIAQRFQLLWSSINKYLEISDPITPPRMTFYHSMFKKDAFLSNTENMYT